MSKYDPLGKFLERNNSNTIAMTFDEIEEVLGFELPMYLQKYGACWYGTAEGSPTHVAKAVWQAVGYQVETINLLKKEVVFKKVLIPSMLNLP